MRVCYADAVMDKKRGAVLARIVPRKLKLGLTLAVLMGQVVLLRATE